VPDLVESFFDVQKDGGCAQFVVRICCQLVDEADKLVGCGVLWMESELFISNFRTNRSVKFRQNNAFKDF